MTPPPRRLPSRVYRRRRAGVLLALVVLVTGLAVVVAMLPRAGASDSASSPTPTVALPTLYPTTTPQATPGAAPACTADSVAITAVTDATSYAPGEDPQLSLSLTNTSSTDCVIDAGTSKQVFTITSGSERIWTSTDCQTGAVDLSVLLQAGRSVTGSALTWDRTRSSADTCSGGREAVPAGGAAYNLSVSVAGIASGSPTQFLLR
ncbi:hypothetical protein [Rathayibacter rathayi]|uniref:hypothetical protein n=1 Tax=Rathayibacter rathayi TaxID=33887 RepID=UPI000CE76C7C|nr:hypothetical protein [Rathayibacter rathayi]PPF21471.1 hypothetical protein C5C34_12925 [Rathayibacter rathayi]PPG88112.1 hypothetical protein C5C47_08515 [Rathayibacter rathayi]PPG92409.1 hypothetical protein C5C22_12800 [Rathayibacter rathayi]PPG96445.1 hypothetical protein C5C00_08605 [Rathayibacter rathayi]PPH67660.1 hypothetical protein C5C45_08825 [Rathayibacter rathayi]